MPGGIDYEIRRHLHAEPPTPEELEYMDDIDPTEAGIFLHKLYNIAAEGNETLIKLGASTGCRWGDTGCAIYTKSGDNAVCATGLYFHSVLGSAGVKYINKHWKDDPSVGVKPGDAFFCNESFYLGTHGPDMGIYIPIFYKDQLVCWAGAVVHSGENGSCEPGGMPTSSRSIYDEGLHIAPLKISENYLLKEDIVNAFNHMVRDPRAMTLDIKARMAALRIIERRLKPVIEKVGPEHVIGALRYVIKVTGDAAKKRVSQWRDGKFHHVQFIDSVGSLPRLMKVEITLEKIGDRMYFDYDGTSPEVVDRVINTPAMGAIGVNTVYLLGHLFNDLPRNIGALEPMSFKIPEGSIANASRESPKAGCAYVHDLNSLIVQYLIQQLIYSVNPERTECSGNRGFTTITYGGLNQYGAAFGDIGAEMNGVGFGARSYKDGVNVAGSYFAPMTSEPGEVESLEASLPFLYLYRGFHEDSCGHGKYRGGVGMDYAIQVHGVPGVNLGTWGYGTRITITDGIFGGYGVPALPCVTISDNNLTHMYSISEKNIPRSSHELYESKVIKGEYKWRGYPSVVEPSSEGDLLVGGMGGGAGYGDPLNRDPQAVMKDLDDGVISHWAAQNVYKVSYDEASLSLNMEETRRLRQEERENRKKRGIKYSDFEREWMKRKPPEEILEFYGEWPNPTYEEFTCFGPWIDESK